MIAVLLSPPSHLFALFSVVLRSMEGGFSEAPARVRRSVDRIIFLLWRTVVILVDVSFYDVPPWYLLTSDFMTCCRDTRWRQLSWRAAVILADVSFYDVLPWYLLMSVFMTYRRDSCWRQLFNPDNIACSSFIRNWTWCNFDNKRHDRIFWPSTFTMTFLDLRPVIFVITLSSTFLNTFAEVFHEKKTLFQF